MGDTGITLILEGSWETEAPKRFQLFLFQLYFQLPVVFCFGPLVVTVVVFGSGVDLIASQMENENQLLKSSFPPFHWEK